MSPAATGTVGGPAPMGPQQGPVALASLMSGRSTFGGNKRRRTTSTGHAMSEAQEGKVTARRKEIYHVTVFFHLFFPSVTHTHLQPLLN